MLVGVAPLLKQPVGTCITIELAEDPIAPHGENAGLLGSGARSIDATIDLTHTDPGVLVEGSATALVAGQCSRCLKDCLTRVRAEFAEQYYAMLDVATGAPGMAAPEDAKTIGSDFRVDLTPLVAEELILAAPFAPLCRQECKGLCLECGADLNAGPHEHAEATDSRWTKLRTLESFHAARE